MFDVGSQILYMKVGTHAREDLESIIKRKQQEIDAVGFSLWGYGGNTCHPTTMVQPFAKAGAATGKPIILAMQPMNSRHFVEPIRAEEYSPNKIDWQQIPDSIDVLGSKFALCLSSLEKIDEELSLDDTSVAVGGRRGNSGASYIKGRVDKACLEVREPSGPPSRLVKIKLVAELVEPYAVFLRGGPPKLA